MKKRFFRGKRKRSDMAWAVIGGKRNYYRSKWERNYARYLEHCKQLGQIKDWEHEPKEFWFEAIRRGVRSYKPDFSVTATNGYVYYVEVKGFMDSKSKTKLKRMKKYHPVVKVVLVDKAEYEMIGYAYSHSCKGWEFTERGVDKS